MFSAKDMQLLTLVLLWSDLDAVSKQQIHKYMGTKIKQTTVLKSFFLLLS